jgi:hypothetical protein
VVNLYGGAYLIVSHVSGSQLVFETRAPSIVEFGIWKQFTTRS